MDEQRTGIRGASSADARDQLTLMRSVLDHLPMAVAELDRDHRIIFVNRHVVESRWGVR